MVGSDTRAHVLAWIAIGVLIALMAGAVWILALLGGWQHV